MGETEHFTAFDHVDVITRQLGPGVLDAVLINSNQASAAAIGPDLAIDPVLPDTLGRLDPSIRVISRNIVSDQNPLRHDPTRLASALLELTNGHWPVDALPIESESLAESVVLPRALVTTGISRE
jgi:2-phospho-L-lactate transferase/gluconeogenesis factor (CofD/UPF0052 family)